MEAEMRRFLFVVETVAVLALASPDPAVSEGMMPTAKQLAEILFALRSPEGLRLGSLRPHAEGGGINVRVVARLTRPSARIDVTFEADRCDIRFGAGDVAVDHTSWLVSKLTDGELHALRFRRDGTATAYVDVTLPGGRTTDMEFQL